MLAQLESHSGDAGGSSFTTQLSAAPPVHDGPFVDQYRSTNASFCVLKSCPSVFSLSRRTAIVKHRW
jgi:hypothetical protein